LNINEYLQSYHDGWNETKIFLHEDLKNTEWKSILWGNTFKNNTLSNLAYFYGSVPFDVLISHHVT
ncbi:MAG: hypothetical protein ABF931_10895, partial [Acetobacter pasteurianus]